MRTILLLSLVAIGCSNPIAPLPAPPSDVAIAHVAPPVWALSGQSNAVNVLDPLRAYATVVGIQQNGQPIARWAPAGDLWLALAETLTPDVRAFIWWQGEIDAITDPSHYAADLRDLLARVRQRLPAAAIVIVGLADMPDPRYIAGYASVRAAQQLVATEIGARYVTAEGEPLDPAVVFHLAPDAYADMARRIAAAIP